MAGSGMFTFRFICNRTQRSKIKYVSQEFDFLEAEHDSVSETADSCFGLCIHLTHSEMKQWLTRRWRKNIIYIQIVTWNGKKQEQIIGCNVFN